jgi:hypothetical protein
MNPKGIARIVEVSKDVFQGEILFDGHLTPTPFACRDFHSTVAIRMQEMYPEVQQIRNQQFLCELDHIKLFGCRSDEQDWTPPMSQEDSEWLADVLEKQEVLFDHEEPEETNVVQLFGRAK